MTRIFESVLSSVPRDAVICDVSVGIFWTCVQTQYGCGLCATAHRWCDDPPGAILPMAGSLIGQRVHDLASLYQAPSLTARALAVASLNAACPSFHSPGLASRAQDLIAQRAQASNASIALIGHFHFGEDFKALGLQVETYELDHRCEPGDIPVSLAPERLKTADIVVMTSSTLVTHATEDLIAWARPDAYKVIVGPSVPLSPCLWDAGIDAVCGSRIRDARQVLLAVRQGANHKQLVGAEKVCFLKE